MKGWLRKARRCRSGRVGRSIEPHEGQNCKCGAGEAVNGPGSSEPMPAGKCGDGNEDTQDLVPKGPSRHVENINVPGEVTGNVSGNFGWQFLHGGQSLTISGFAAIVVVAVDVVDPGHMSLWAVFGSVGVYVAGVVLFFAIERRRYRKRRARFPVDVSGGGRLGLTVAAMVLCFAGGDQISGLAGWIAYSALLLGSCSDGAWIALVAERRNTGLWRAWWTLARSEREAQAQCWRALFGESGR